MKGLPVSTIYHANWRLGIGSSIRTGLACAMAINPALSAVVIMVCDQPFVDANVLRHLVAVREQTGKPIAACEYAGALGVPAVFERSLFPQLATLPNAQGAKSLFGGMEAEIATISFDKGSVDIDTPEDCAAYLG